MTIKVANPHVTLTDHAMRRIKQRTDITAAAAKGEIREGLRRGDVSVDGRSTFLVHCGPREYAVARRPMGGFVVLTVLLTAGLAVAA